MLFDSTVRKELARSFGATLVVILTIVLTMMLIRTLGLAANGSVSPEDVVLVLAYTSLGHLPTMLALAMFIAVVLSLGRMYRDSEMAIWFSSGVGLTRFIRPVLRTGWPVLVVVAVLVLVAWPWGNRQLDQLKQRYEQRSDISRVAPGSFQASRDGGRVFFVEREGESAGIGRNVFLLSRQGDEEAITTARAGRIVTEAGERFLVLDRGFRNEQRNPARAYVRTDFDEFRMLVDAREAQAAQALPPKSMGTLELLREAAPRNQGELTWRLGLLFGACNMLLLAIGTSATHPRRPSNWNLLFALLTFVVYYNLVNLSQAWVTSGRLDMGVALAVLHVGVVMLALLLIWWRDHSLVLKWRPRGPVAGTGSAT